MTKARGHQTGGKSSMQKWGAVRTSATNVGRSSTISMWGANKDGNKLDSERRL